MSLRDYGFHPFNECCPKCATNCPHSPNCHNTGKKCQYFSDDTKSLGLHSLYECLNYFTYVSDNCWINSTKMNSIGFHAYHVLCDKCSSEGIKSSYKCPKY